MRFGYPSEPPTLDPLAPGGASAATRDILRPLMPALFALDEKLQPVPELVDNWPSKKDITTSPFTVKLTLRRASWSDERPITAGDVRFSWEKLRKGPNGYRYRYLTDVEVIGPRKLRLHFDHLMRRWWSLFSLDDMVLPAHAYTGAWKDGPTVTGGPFAFGGWTKGLKIALVRNDSYWARRAGVRAIDVFFVPDDETRLLLLDRHELDAFSSDGDTNMGRRAAARGYTRTTKALGGAKQASGAWASEWWELDIDPLRTGAAVAQAIGQAVDPALAAEILEDAGQTMDGIPSRFPAPGATKENGPPIAGPWAGRGSADAAKRALATGASNSPGRVVTSGGAVTVTLAFNRDTAAANLAGFIFFRLQPLRIRADLVGRDTPDFERLLASGSAPPAVLRLRRGADAPDSSAYVFGPPVAAEASAADVVRAETSVAAKTLRSRPVTGLDPGAWASAQRAIAATNGVLPLARARAWIVGRGVGGPLSTGTSSGPFWNAATWRFG